MSESDYEYKAETLSNDEGMYDLQTLQILIYSYYAVSNKFYQPLN